MSKKVWLITGAGRGMGVDFARAALASGHSVVASGRDRERVSRVLGTSSDLLAVKLDVTSAADAEAAVRAAVDRFGRIDVLVNNAASFYAGYFEELTPDQMSQQIAASLIGPMNVTRAALPVMRKQRSGHIISISSSAGPSGFEFGTAYAASKFGLEGWMESLHAEVAPFGISTTIVNPGFFRTELLTEQSTNFAEPSIEDYDERRTKQLEFWKAQNGQHSVFRRETERPRRSSSDTYRRASLSTRASETRNCVETV
jgi:NAD(P)-dependent dehydrogenase (short-subunit alcohol dehydrogenase family)